MQCEEYIVRIVWSKTFLDLFENSTIVKYSVMWGGVMRGPPVYIWYSVMARAKKSGAGTYSVLVETSLGLLLLAWVTFFINFADYVSIAITPQVDKFANL